MILSTLLYDGNIDGILSETSWFLNFKSPVIQSKLIIINNIQDRQLTERKILDRISDHNDIEYFFVDDCEQEVIEFFKLDINKETTVGYYYIIPYFALIYKLKTGIVFHVSHDCMHHINFSDDFLLESIKEITTNDKIPATTIGWRPPKASYGYDVGEWEQIEVFQHKQKSEPDMENFWYTVAFSDQVFVANIDKFITFDYNLTPYINPFCPGPSYCPDSWERRATEFLYRNNMYRAVWKRSDEYYLH
jgi:hypothetical protein